MSEKIVLFGKPGKGDTLLWRVIGVFFALMLSGIVVAFPVVVAYAGWTLLAEVSRETYHAGWIAGGLPLLVAGLVGTALILRFLYRLVALEAKTVRAATAMSRSRTVHLEVKHWLASATIEVVPFDAIRGVNFNAGPNNAEEAAEGDVITTVELKAANGRGWTHRFDDLTGALALQALAHCRALGIGPITCRDTRIDGEADVSGGNANRSEPLVITSHPWSPWVQIGLCIVSIPILLGVIGITAEPLGTAAVPIVFALAAGCLAFTTLGRARQTLTFDPRARTLTIADWATAVPGFAKMKRRTIAFDQIQRIDILRTDRGRDDDGQPLYRYSPRLTLAPQVGESNDAVVLLTDSYDEVTAAGRAQSMAQRIGVPVMRAAGPMVSLWDQAPNVAPEHRLSAN